MIDSFRTRRRRGFARLVTLLCLGIGNPHSPVFAAPTPPPPASDELRLLEVAPNSFAEQAGLQPGDVLVSWQREAAPPFNLLPAFGTFRSPFDLLEAMIEEAPRGVVNLTGRREGQPRSWVLPAGASWERFGVRIGSDEPSWRMAQSALDLDRERRFDEGDTAFAQSVDLLTLKGRRASAAWILEAWGRSLAQRSLWDRAVEIQSRAIELLRSGREGDLSLARAYFERGETYRMRFDYPRASADLSTALRLRQAYAPGSSEEGLSLFSLGRTFVEGGGRSRGDLLIAEAESVQRRVDPSSLDRVRTLIYWSVQVWERGERKLGDQGLAEALRLARRLAPFSYETARALNFIGRYAGRRSEIERTESNLREALEMWRALPPGYTNLYNLASCLTDLSQLSVAVGDFDTAVAYADESLETQRRINPRSFGVAGSLNTRGYVAQMQGDLPLARTSFREAVALTRSLTSDPLSLAISLEWLGSLEVQAGEDLAAGESILHEAKALMESAGEEYTNLQFGANIYMDLALLASKRGKVPEAIRWQELAQSIRTPIAPQTTSEAGTLAALGMFELEAGRKEAAARHLCSAIEIVERVSGLWAGAERARSQFIATFAEDVRNCVSALVVNGRIATAFRTLERGKARGLLELLGGRRPRVEDFSPELREEGEALRQKWEGLQNRIPEVGAKPEAPEAQEALRHLAELQRRKDDWVVRARIANPRVASLYFPQPLTARDARQLVEPGSLLLEYSIGAKGGWLFLIPPIGGGGPDVRVVRLASTESEIRRDVERLRRLLSAPLSQSAEVGRAARKLRRSLLSPIEKYLRGSKRLVIVPDGPLYDLPFSALQTETGRYLIEDYEISVVGSATVLGELKASTCGSKYAAGKGEVAVFGDPSGGAEERIASGEVEASGDDRLGRVSPLPAARREAEAVADFFPRSRLYLGGAASEDLAKRLDERFSLVHFAVHAILDKRVPVNSALLLAASAQGAGRSEDGYLRTWEIMEDLRLCADLVTLSACGSGLGRELPGEGLVGLARAFLFAGARSVLASLWSVNDRSTAKFMQSFYGHLAAGESKSASLRRAQLESLHSKDAKEARPYAWAPFELLGEAGPMSDSSRRH